MVKAALPRIVIDSREQLPYEFEGHEKVRAGLKTGDYSLEGYESRVCVERKSKEDMYGVVGAGRKRFVRELERMVQYERRFIVIEADLATFAIPPPRTRVDSRMAVGSVLSWCVAYNVPVLWCGDRRYAERVVVRLLAAFYKYCVAK